MSWIFEYALPFMLILMTIVFVHELGHFIVARRYGVKVTVFSIGFGPEVFGFTDRHGTRWCFAPIPMGGYVKMLGDADASSAKSDVSQLSENDKKLTLASKTPGQRIAVAAAGPIANFLFSILALTFLMVLKGIPFYPAKIGMVEPTMIAAKAGLMVGDTIEAINGSVVKEFHELRDHIVKSAGHSMELKIDRQGEKRNIVIDLFEKDPYTQTIKPISRLGIGPAAPEYVRYNPLYGLVKSVEVIFNICTQTLVGISQMLTGQKGAGDLGGVLAIGDMASQSVKNGWATVVWFMVVLSVNLGLLNLFPIPVLDGGHIVMCTLEILRGKPLSEKLQERIYFVGLIIVLSLMVYATWNDFSRYGIVQMAMNGLSQLKTFIGL